MTELLGAQRTYPFPSILLMIESRLSEVIYRATQAPTDLIQCLVPGDRVAYFQGKEVRIAEPAAHFCN